MAGLRVRVGGLCEKCRLSLGVDTGRVAFAWHYGMCAACVWRVRRARLRRMVHARVCPPSAAARAPTPARAARRQPRGAVAPRGRRAAPRGGARGRWPRSASAQRARAPAPARGTRRVRLVRGEARGVSTLVREGGGGGKGGGRTVPPVSYSGAAPRARWRRARAARSARAPRGEARRAASAA